MKTIALDHYRCAFSIEAPASAVYAALTQPDGLRSWWTATCDVGTGVGQQSTFRFDQTYKVMQLEKLQPEKEIRWRCIDGNIHAPGKLARTNEWIGTTIVFQLASKSPTETLLQFEHIGLNPEVECYGLCTAGWDHFLKSLKSYLETGAGTPYQETSASPERLTGPLKT